MENPSDDINSSEFECGYNPGKEISEAEYTEALKTRLKGISEDAKGKNRFSFTPPGASTKPSSEENVNPTLHTDKINQERSNKKSNEKSFNY